MPRVSYSSQKQLTGGPAISKVAWYFFKVRLPIQSKIMIAVLEQNVPSVRDSCVRFSVNGGTLFFLSLKHKSQSLFP